MIQIRNKYVNFISSFIPTAYAQVANSVTSGAGSTATTTSTGVSEYFLTLLGKLPFVFAGIVVLILAFIVTSIVRGRIVDAIIRSRGEQFEESSIILIKRVITIGMMTLAILLSLQIMGFDLAWLLGALGLGVGFALKDIINNFISGIIILMQDDFKIGDLINVDELKGTIVDIKTRATVLQSLDGTRVTIPNGVILGTTVTSYTSNPFRRISFDVGISFGSNIDTAKELALQIMKSHKRVVQNPESYVIVNRLDASAVNLSCRFWVQSRGSSWLLTRSELIRDIKSAFEQNNIEIPFPITTLEGGHNAIHLQKGLT